MSRRRKKLTDADRKEIRGRLIVWHHMLQNACGHIDTALHYIANPTVGTVHSTYAVNGCLIAAMMRYGTIRRKGYAVPRLVKANREVYPEYWEMALKESLSHTERILFDQILWKIDSHRDNALAHSNAEYLNATDMGFVATVSINGAMKFSLEEIKVWAMLTDKIIGGIMIVHDKIREQETTQYPPFLIAGKMIEVKENPVDE